MNKSIAPLLVLVALSTMLAPTAGAQPVYKCPKSGGGTQFTDMPCEGGTKIQEARPPESPEETRQAMLVRMRAAYEAGNMAEVQRIQRVLVAEEEKRREQAAAAARGAKGQRSDRVTLDPNGPDFYCDDPKHSHRKKSFAYFLPQNQGGGNGGSQVCSK